VSVPRASIYVFDTGPLITLAAAESLDYLLYPNVPVVIPDAVFYESTRDSARLGAQSIMDWVKAHHTEIEIAVTNAYVNFDAARLVNPGAYEPNLGKHHGLSQTARSRAAHPVGRGRLRARAGGRPQPVAGGEFGEHDPSMREAVRDTLRAVQRDRSPQR
jgi:hypothetical protein